MSADQVDDVENAEDRMHSAAEKLRELIHAVDDARGGLSARIMGRAKLAQARQSGLDVLESITLYCRPTCGAEGVDHDGEALGGDDTCGCPCHDRWVPAEVVQAARDAFTNRRDG